MIVRGPRLCCDWSSAFSLRPWTLWSCEDVFPPVPWPLPPGHLGPLRSRLWGPQGLGCALVCCNRGAPGALDTYPQALRATWSHRSGPVTEPRGTPQLRLTERSFCHSTNTWEHLSWEEDTVWWLGRHARLSGQSESLSSHGGLTPRLGLRATSNPGLKSFLTHCSSTGVRPVSLVGWGTNGGQFLGETWLPPSEGISRSLS